MTPKEIKQFNKGLRVPDSSDQGIFSEPWGIPVKIKKPVLYMRYETGGYSGGSCWDNSNPEPYSSNNTENTWVALDKFLDINCPDITYLKYKKIEELVHTNEETEHEYYGNSTDYIVKYIKLSELEDFIEKL